MQDVVELTRNVDVLGDVLLDEVEAFLAEEMRDVLDVPGQEVVHRDHLATIGEHALAEVRAEEAGTTGDQDSFAHCRYLRLDCRSGGWDETDLSR